MALATAAIFFVLYLVVLYQKPEVNWGSSTEGQRYQDTILSILNMSRHLENIKSYSPQILVMAGKPTERPFLLDIGHFITKNGSFMIVADVERKKLTVSERKIRCYSGNEWIRLRKHRAFYVLLDNSDLETGATTLIQTTGLGRLSPNLVLLGYLNKWRVGDREAVGSYFRIIRNAFNNEIPVSILRLSEIGRPVKNKWNAADSTLDIEPSETEKRVKSHISAVMYSDSDMDINDVNTTHTDMEKEEFTKDSQKSKQKAGKKKGDKKGPIPLSLKTSNYKPFTFSQDKYVDAWWLYDDGGLNILLPYIIARRSAKEKTPLRIFALVKGHHKEEDAKMFMEVLLSKLRIDYSELRLVQGIEDEPSKTSWDLFNSLLTNFKSSSNDEILVSDTELQNKHPKTSRYLRLREMILEHSSDAALIIMTLPHPRKDSLSAALYFAWLEILSKDLPHVLFVRGNDSYVLDT